MRSRILSLFIVTFSLLSALETAIPSMVIETPKSFEVNSCQSLLTIDELGNRPSTVSLDANSKSLGFACLQNYPNPFSSSTVISFRLSEQSEAELVIYNLMGQKVRTLVRSRLQEGYHSLCWDGTDSEGHLLAGGVYLCRLKAGGGVKVRKMILLR